VSREGDRLSRSRQVQVRADHVNRSLGLSVRAFGVRLSKAVTCPAHGRNCAHMRPFLKHVRLSIAYERQLDRVCKCAANCEHTSCSSTAPVETLVRKYHS